MTRQFKRCLITGITGSGGSYLADHIISKKLKIKIHGFYRSKGYLGLLKKNDKNKIKFIKVDLTDFKNTLNGLKRQTQKEDLEAKLQEVQLQRQANVMPMQNVER